MTIILVSVISGVGVGFGFAIREYRLTKKISIEPEPVLFR